MHKKAPVILDKVGRMCNKIRVACKIYLNSTYRTKIEQNQIYRMFLNHVMICGLLFFKRHFSFVFNLFNLETFYIVALKSVEGFAKLVKKKTLNFDPFDTILLA